MTLVTWNPFRELENSFYRNSGLLNRSDDNDDTFRAGWRPVANISETDSEYVIKAELPAVAKEDVDITVNEGIVTIKGERRQETADEGQQYHRTESVYGRFMRSFKLPADVDESAIRAASKDGLLEVHLPKAEAKTPKPIQIDVN